VLADGEDANLQSQLYTSASSWSTELVDTASFPACWICWKRRPFSSAKPATNCATIVTVWISIRTVCLSLSSASPARFLARKHHVTPEELPNLSVLLEEQQQLDDQAGSLESLSTGGESASSAGAGDSKAAACPAPAVRQELSQHITESMHSLSMPHGVFAIDVRFDERHLTAEGADH
jgi:DNA repair protein RecN (Recombination protein N)